MMYPPIVTYSTYVWKFYFFPISCIIKQNISLESPTQTKWFGTRFLKKKIKRLTKADPRQSHALNLSLLCSATVLCKAFEVRLLNRAV